MSEQQSADAVPADGGTRPWLSAVVDGDEVRALVARSEQEIEALLRELEAVRREADEAEQRLLEHPSATLLGALPGSLAPAPDAPLRHARPASPAAAPRTVVDRRPPPDGPSATGAVATPTQPRRRHRRQTDRRRVRGVRTPRRQRSRDVPAGERASRRARAGSFTAGWWWMGGALLLISGLLVWKLG